jgi:hypothetical protein
MKRWLGRLSFSFLIVGVVLAWESYQAHAGRRANVPPWRVPAFATASVILIALFFVGIRFRHRRDDEPSDQ